MTDKPIVKFPQLVAVAKNILLTAPEYDSASWKLAIRETLTALGYASPSGSDINRAMDAVEASGVRLKTPPGDPPPPLEDFSDPTIIETPEIVKRQMASTSEFTPVMASLPTKLRTLLKDVPGVQLPAPRYSPPATAPNQQALVDAALARERDRTWAEPATVATAVYAIQGCAHCRRNLKLTHHCPECHADICDGCHRKP